MDYQLTKHIRRSETVCPCGKCNVHSADSELLDILESVRHFFCGNLTGNGIGVHIHSLMRCEKHNRDVGGKEKTSMHLFGCAGDIHIIDKLGNRVDPEDVYNLVDRRNPNRFGIGVYNTFTHIDVRPVRARWDERA